MPIDTRPSDLVFDQRLKPFKGRKKLSRGYGGWAIFLWKFQRGGELTFPCENGKSEGSYKNFQNVQLEKMPFVLTIYSY